MATVPITIVGNEVAPDGTTTPISIVGMASITGLVIGGGPIVPPTVVPPQPPLIPQFPIAGGPDPGWPDKPGYPDYITGWPVPVPPVTPPDGGGTPNPPGMTWKPVVAWTPDTGWIVVGIPVDPIATPSKTEAPAS